MYRAADSFIAHSSGRHGARRFRGRDRTCFALPPGAGVPQRLRALLLKRARKERWSRAHLARAVRGAGPDASFLLKELEPKDPLQKGIKWILLKAHIHF